MLATVALAAVALAVVVLAVVVVPFAFVVSPLFRIERCVVYTEMAEKFVSLI